MSQSALSQRDLDTPRLRVVVADDDDDMRSLVAEGLRRDRHVVAELEHGGQVLELLAVGGANPPKDLVDVLVTDVRMPYVDGVLLVRTLRAAGWACPAIIMTAFGDEQTHAAAHELGALILDKPFELHDLRQLVIYAWELATSTRARSAPPPTTQR